MYLSTRSKVMAALALFTSLFAVGTVVSPAQASVQSATSAVVKLQDRATASDQASAMAVAQKYDHPVVDESKTTETSKVSALSDGTMQLVVNSLPVRVHRGNVWVAADATLQHAADGTVVPIATSVAVEFSGGGSSFLARVQTDTGKWVTESWPYGELPAPKLSGATATYSEVFPGVDLNLTASVTGMSEVFVVKSATAIQDPRVADLSLAVSGATVSTKSGKQIVASAADGSVLTSSAPVWWDSSKTDADASGPAGGDFAAPLQHSVAGKTLSLDTRSVAKSNVTYPVYIDPDWTGGVYNRWFIDRGYPTTSYLNPSTRLKLGYASAALSTDGVNHLARMFFAMDTSGVASKQILAAHFNTTETYSGSCTPMAVELWWVGSGTPGASWNNTTLGWISNMDTQTVAHGRSACPASAVGFNALQGVQAAAASNAASLTLGLKATAESDSRSYKEFSPSASLTITYNSVPGTPAALQYTSPTRTCSNDPANPTSIDATQPITLQATASDADSGQNLETAFTVSGVTQTSFSWSKASPRGAAGPESVTLPVNILAVGDYRWHAQTNDGVGGVSSIASDCYLRAVTASPTVPTVTKTSTESAVVGMPMTVQFGSATSDGVKVFAYWWAVGTPATPPTPPVMTPITPGQPLPACGSASGSVRFACPAPGSLSSSIIAVAPVDVQSTLWVASYNDAGRVSLAANGLYAASGLAVSATADTADVSLSVGHIWDSQALTVSATAVPDLNTTSGSSGPMTRQELGQPLQLVDGDFFGLPTTVLSFTTASTASASERTAIDTKSSFTVSAWLLPSATSAAGVEHVALSESALNSAAFTLGTDTSGKTKFCRTSQVDQAQTCVIGPVLSAGGWTMVTGIWDSVNQNLRLVIDATIAPSAVTSQPVPSGDSSADGWLCVGGSCGMSSGSLTTTVPWDGQVFRPAVFPGVVSAGQLGSLFSVLSPNDDPPADGSIGTVVNLRCDQLITPQQMYDYDPNLSGLSPWTPTAGSAAYRAQQWNGLACRWLRETGGVSMDISVASIVDRGTMVQLQTAAQTGTPVAGLGTSAYYANHQLQIFSGTYWLVLQYDWAGEAIDFTPLGQDALAALSTLS